MNKKRIAAIGVAVVALAGIAVVFAFRHKTRLRLSYPPGEVTVTRDVVYVPDSTNRKHRLDVYAPKNARGAPVVHFVHGGYWIQGDKDHFAFATGLYGSVGEALARRGIVTVVQSYRLAPEVAIEGILDDVVAGLRWTHAHAAEHGGDPARLFIMGHSAGGHLTALIGADDAIATKRGFDPRSLRGFIVLSGVWDIAEMSEEQGPKLRGETTFAVFGEDRARWPAYSPQSRLHPGMAPFFIAIGEHDYAYMIPQAERARDKLTALGGSPKLLKLPDTDHAGVVLTFGAAGDQLSDPVAAFVTAR